MFKSYLRMQPARLNIAAFLFIWAGFLLIFNFLQPVIIAKWMAISVGEVPDFVRDNLLQHPELLVVLNALGAVLIFLLPALIFAYLADPAPFAYLGLKKATPPNRALVIAMLALGLIFILGVLGGWLKEINLGKSANELDQIRTANINAYLQSGSWGMLLRNLFFLALLPAVAEELFFRGVVQKFAYTFTRKAGAAIFISALFFALVHFSIYEFLPILLGGVVLGWVYQTTGVLWWNIWLHFLVNGLQIIGAYVAARSGWEETEATVWQATLVLAGGVALAAWAGRRLYRTRTPLPDDWSVTVAESKDHHVE